jgi:hypothetical protein
MEHITEYVRLKQAFEALRELEEQNQEPDAPEQTINQPTRVPFSQRIFGVMRWLLKGTHTADKRDFHSEIR